MKKHIRLRCRWCRHETGWDVYSPGEEQDLEMKPKQCPNCDAPAALEVVKEDAEALIQVSRVSTGGLEDEVQVEVLYGDNHIRVALPLRGYADMVTGEAKVPCQVRRWRTA